MPEGYELSEEAEALTVTVELGGAQMYETAEYVNGFCQTYNATTGECSNTNHTNCSGYQPATLTTEEYDIDNDGTKDSVYEISNAGQLYWFAGLINGDTSVCTGDVTQNTAANAVLTADITVNTGVLKENGDLNTGDFRSWTPIGGSSAYTGIFDGNSNTISGLYHNVESSEQKVYVGLFGSSTGTIKNVGIDDSYFRFVLKDGSEVCFIGGLCGINGIGARGGTIENCNNAATVSVTATATIANGYDGFVYVSGVCGDNVYGTIKNCNNSGKVSSTVSTKLFGGNAGSNNTGVGGVCGINIAGASENCYNTGEVSGTYNVGGVCGENGWSYHQGTIIKNCYNMGAVSGTENVGGVCGENYNGSTIESCHNTDEVIGTSSVGGVCGKVRCSKITNCYNTNTGKVTGSSYVGGVCGEIEVDGGTTTIENCYNAWIGTGIGGVYGGIDYQSAGIVNITNCYYLSATATEDGGKTEKQFKSGEVCYLLNGSTSEGTAENPLAWYQNIDNGTADAYPALDSGHGTVYQCKNCTGVYSNTQDKSAAHSFKPDENGTTHTCEKCGFSEAHSTTNLTYTANDTTDTITVICGECSGNLGTVSLSKPTGTLTYDGNAKEAVISNGVTGVTISNPAITYSKKDVSSFSGVPTTAGTYTASITLGTGEGAKTVSVTYEITKVAASVGTAPSAKTGLTYNGTAQELVTAGSNVTGGTLKYSTSQNGEYSITIPTGTGAKQYSVWYKVVGDENHADTTPVEIKVAIAPLTITNENTTITLGTALTYTGTKQTQSIASVTVGAMTLGAGDYTISNNTGTAAGNDYELTVTGTGNFTGTATKKFSIKKKPVTGTNQTLLVKTGSAKDITYDLGKLLPEGVTGTTTYKIGTVSDAKKVLSPDPSDTDITGGKLTLHVASVAKKDLSATVKITFTNANYEISEAVLTIQTTDKIPVILSGVTCGSRAYNGTAYAYTGTPLWKTEEDETAAGETTVTYYKAEDPSAPVAAPANAGSYQAVFTITSDKYVGTASCSFEITKAEITIAAKDRNIYTGDTVPDLTNPVLGTDYTVTGLYGTDVLGGTVSMSYEPDGQKPDNTKEGTYKILIGGLTAPEGDNYTITFTNGTLTITPKPSGDSSDKPGSEGGSGGSSGGSTGGGSSFGGGNSSGSGSTSGVTTGKDSGSNTVTTTSPTEVKVENGTASATVKAENIAEAIKQAADNKSAQIVFAVSEKDTGNADRIQLTITKADVKQILEKTSADLVAATTAGNVILPKEALKETVSAAGGDTITIEIDKVTAPTAVQKEAAGENSYIVEVTIMSQNKAITSFGGNVLKIRLEIPVALAGKDVAVIHIAEDGKTEKMPGKVVTEGAKQYYEFTTTHLSTFALIEETETKEETPAATAPKKGTLLTDSKTQMVYKVTKSGTDGGTVQFVKAKNAKAKTVAIPDKVTIDGITYKVTSIASGVLKNNKTVTTVTIGRNVAVIGSRAFCGCTRLKKVTIGKSVTAIGAKAFYNCSSLTALAIPSKVEKIGNYAFKGLSSLKTIRINTKLLTTKTVSEYAFSGISTSTAVKVPKSRLKTYKTLFVKKGLDKKVVIKKW